MTVAGVHHAAGLAQALVRWQHAAGPFWPYVCAAPFLSVGAGGVLVGRSESARWRAQPRDRVLVDRMLGLAHRQHDRLLSRFNVGEEVVEACERRTAGNGRGRRLALRTRRHPAGFRRAGRPRTQGFPAI